MPGSFLKSTLLAIALGGLSANVQAVPLLQLDIADGYFHSGPGDLGTIVARASPFTLYAIGTPSGTTQGASYSLSRLLSETFYISAAVSPQVAEPGKDLGYFTANGQTVLVTQDMVFGKPPIEVFGELQGYDSGDLRSHESIYPTYFTEFAFRFSNPTIARVDTYDSVLNSGGPTFNPNGSSLAYSLVLDMSGLNTNYAIHFDLYNERLKLCGAQETALVNGSTCRDIDANQYAPFDHDAQSPPVPEPATLVLFGTSLAAGAVRRYRNGRSAQR
jgi:PEP-CTERM motif-containing protein